MSGFRRSILLWTAPLLLLGMDAVSAQPAQLFEGWPTPLTTKNIPAGTVVDPGSQLLYVIDTGVNLRRAVGADLSSYTSSLSVVDQGPRDADNNFIAPNPFGVGGERSIYDADAEVNLDSINRNFITITNTHPTQAVTLHLWYFNEDAVNVLDFLLPLGCNDSLVFNAFDFAVPSSDVDVQRRLFGTPGLGSVEPISARVFGSGRFYFYATLVDKGRGCGNRNESAPPPRSAILPKMDSANPATPLPESGSVGLTYKLLRQGLRSIATAVRIALPCLRAIRGLQNLILGADP